MTTKIIIQDAEQVTGRQYVNRAAVALAVEAGIAATIKALVGLAKDEGALLRALKAELADTNPPLAQALSVELLKAIMDYLVVADAPAVVPVEKLPKLLNENGPASVSAARDGGDATQINITFNGPPDGYTYELYLDGVLAKAGALTGAWVNEALFGVTAGAHTIRVLYINAEGDMTRFGPIASIN